MLWLYCGINRPYEFTYPVQYFSRSVRLIGYAFEYIQNIVPISGYDEPTTGVRIVAYRSERLMGLVDKRGYYLTKIGQALRRDQFSL